MLNRNVSEWNDIPRLVHGAKVSFHGLCRDLNHLIDEAGEHVTLAFGAFV
jgi:hypothetical protein